MEGTSWSFLPARRLLPTEPTRAAVGPSPASAPRPDRAGRLRVALPLPEPPPKAAELPVDILPPELALVRKLLPPDFQLPPDVLAAMVLPTVPLANATLTTWSYLLHPQFLDDFYADHRGRCYEDLLDFPRHRRPDPRRAGPAQGQRLPALERRRRAGRVADLPGGLLRQAAPHPARAQRGLPRRGHGAAGPLLLPASPRAEALPASLDEFEVICLDGKPIKRVAKRLEPARGRPGKLIGGKVLVAYTPRHRAWPWRWPPSATARPTTSG